MTTYINDGWVVFTNGTHDMKCAAESVEFEETRKPEIAHYTGGVSYGYDNNESYWIISVKNILFDNVTDKDEFLTYLKSWQQAGTLSLSVYRNSSSTKEKIDGSHTDFPVMYKKTKYNKISNGDQTYYMFKEIKFEQSGTAT